MKQIRTFHGDVIEVFNSATEPMSPKTFDETMAPVRYNKLRILETALTIEGIYNRIITEFFFGKAHLGSSGCKDFQALILNSDWCAHSSKRKLMWHIVCAKGILEGSEKAEFEKLSRKVISYRNAFTHGTFSTDGREVKLSYFEGAPKAQFLTDEYLSEVESDLNQCFRLAFKISEILSGGDGSQASSAFSTAS
jgi:hypothetical protein